MLLFSGLIKMVARTRHPIISMSIPFTGTSKADRTIRGLDPYATSSEDPRQTPYPRSLTLRYKMISSMSQGFEDVAQWKQVYIWLGHSPRPSV